MHYCIGDIHANIKALRQLLDVLHPAANDTLVFLGDYIDKNPATTETLQLLHHLNQQYQCIFLKGNHEYVWERYLCHCEVERAPFLLTYGGREALEEMTPDAAALIESGDIDTIQRLLRSYVDLFPLMKDYVIIGDYLALHAGITAAQLAEDPLQFHEKNYFLRPREIPTEQKYLARYVMVAGHTHLKDEPTIFPGYINIDVGAAYGPYMAAFCPETKTITRSDGEKFSL